MERFDLLAPLIAEIAAEECPARILEISAGTNKYGYLLKTMLANANVQDAVLDRIVLSAPSPMIGDGVYNYILDEGILAKPDTIGRYDLIVVLDLFERLETGQALLLLELLRQKAGKQVLLFTPLDCGAGYRRYHPVVFAGFDFHYSLLRLESETMQAYRFFPKTPHGPHPLDMLPPSPAKSVMAKPLRIAFPLPHHGLTGGMKALLQQIRYLSRRGHTVKVYFRSDTAANAIPPWSELTASDYASETVIPASGRYLDYIEDVDVILLGWMLQIPEFVSSKIPVALWEQGSEIIFGDFGRNLQWASQNRLAMHALFRMPIHLIAVSEIIASILKGIYNRDVLIAPTGVDTEFYYPVEKQNDIPVILLIGSPALSFKGFPFAFDVLSRTAAAGLRFQVKWASQIPVQYGEINFPLEVFVNPPQQELASMYRSADLFFSCSLYESYALPPLEAMASGTAVVATDCGGIRAYAVQGQNCLLLRQGDLSAAADALTLLISDHAERERLARTGRLTALEHSSAHAAEAMERCLLRIARGSNL